MEHELERELELNLFALNLEKVRNVPIMCFFPRLILKELFFQFFYTTYCAYFFPHNVKMSESLSGGVVINAFFGTNPLITDANVALDAYVAAYGTALSASLHTTSGRMRSFLHRGRMKRFFCHRRTPYAINITRYI